MFLASVCVCGVHIYGISPFTVKHILAHCLNLEKILHKYISASSPDVVFKILKNSGPGVLQDLRCDEIR